MIIFKTIKSGDVIELMLSGENALLLTTISGTIVNVISGLFFCFIDMRLRLRGKKGNMRQIRVYRRALAGHETASFHFHGGIWLLMNMEDIIIIG